MKEERGCICPTCGDDLVCPFELYELQVAVWLHGQVAGNGQPYFDVWKCADFPELTFQVKHSNAIKCRRININASNQWDFTMRTVVPDQPDYFVLFGITEEGQEHCFLLIRKTFMENASFKRKDGGCRLSMRTKRFSRMHYHVRENKYWQYEVTDPEHNLIDRVRTYEMFKQQRLF